MLQLAIVLLSVVLALAAAARRLPIPYPVVLVVGGLALPFIPGMPRVAVNPDVIFNVFLPPILWAAAYESDLRQLRRSALPIAGLAVGLVVLTTVAVAWVAHKTMPGIPWSSAFILGAVVLAVTGAEALYADMGHFGKRPIRLAWFAAAFPCLLLNYYGQGGLLLRDMNAAANPFYLLAPKWFLYPLVGIATLAAIVGGGTLGHFIVQGIFTRDLDRVVGAAILVALLAILTEMIFSFIERRAVSPGLRDRARPAIVEHGEVGLSGTGIG